MTETATADPLVEALAAQLRATRDTERDLFNALDPEVRDRPMRPGDWSPKDHQAHLTSWRAIQANRIHAARLGEPIPTDVREDDEINAELQATRADWAWDAIAAEADEVNERLIAEIQAAGPSVMTETERLLAGVFGNGPFHAITHFGWLRDANIGVDAARVSDFVDTMERLLDTSSLPDADRGVGIYNLACAHAVAGRLDRARALLRIAFRFRPDLAEYAKEDSDLIELREELAALSA
jgi:DinB superfamily